VNTIYLVTQGSYSDYRVVCAFATENLADAYAKHLNLIGYEECKRLGWAKVDFITWSQTDMDRAGVLPLQLWDELPIAGSHL
jgi:hypothetical protein